MYKGSGLLGVCAVRVEVRVSGREGRAPCGGGSAVSVDARAVVVGGGRVCGGAMRSIAFYEKSS